MRAQHRYWAATEVCPYNWRRLWGTCTLAQVVVKLTLSQAEIREVSSISGDLQLLLRHKPLLGATPCRANGAGRSRGFWPQNSSPRPGPGAYVRNLNKSEKGNLTSFEQYQGLA